MASKNQEPQPTLVDVLLQRLKNNPIAATIIVAAMAVGAAGTFYKALPDDWKPCLRCLVENGDPYRGLPENGWIHAGYLDKEDIRIWSQGPNVEIIKMSGSPTRPYPIRIGDIVRPLAPLPQVIVGYSTTGSLNVLTAPPELVSEINPKRDYTGRRLRTTGTYMVHDVSLANYPGHDYVVWLRVTPYPGAD